MSPMDKKKLFMMHFVFNAVIIFGIPAAFIVGQNYPNDGIVAIFPYAIMQLVLAVLVSVAFWYVILRDKR